MTIGSVTQTPTAAFQAAQAAENFGKAAPAVIKTIEAEAARLISEAAAANVAAANVGTTLPEGAPALRSPDLALATASLPGGAEQAARLTPEAQLALLVAELQKTITDGNFDSMAARAQVFQEAMLQMKASYERVLAESAQAQEKVDTTTQAAIEAGEEAERKLSLVTEAEKTVGALQSKLDALPTDDPARKQVATDLQAAKGELEALRLAAQVAATKFQAATEAVSAAYQELNGQLAETDRLERVLLPGLSVPQERKTNNALLTELLATLHTVMEEAQAKKLAFDAKLTADQLKQQEVENKRRAEEHRKELEKAEHGNKIASCIMKIVTALVTLVMGIATALTGGLLSAALVAVSVMLIIITETTGFDLIGKIIEPFMEHVVKPLADLVGKLVTKILVAMGVDPKKAEQAGQILGTIYAAVAVVVVMILAMVVGKSAGAKIAAKLGPMIQNTMTKLAPGIMSAMGKVGAQVSAVTAKVATEKTAVYAARAQVAASVANFAGQAGASGARIAASVHQVNAQELMSALEVAFANSDAIKERQKMAFDEVARTREIVDGLLLKISDISRTSAQAASGIVANFRTA